MSGAVSLESLENNIKILKDKAAKANKNPNDFSIIVLLYLGRYSNSNKEKVSNSRTPFTGTIDEMCSDLQKIALACLACCIIAYRRLILG
jgi:hypothetical protein